MKRVRYTKYSGDLASELALDDLMQALSDYLLDSGFRSPFDRFQELDGEHTLDNLREALRQALEAGDLFDEETQQKIDQMAEEGALDNLIEKLIDRMEQQNYISIDPPQDPSRMSTASGQLGSAQNINARFEVTEKSLDFLGYKTLSELMGAMGRSSLGRHDTHSLATGVETSGASKLYEFGDVLNLDV